MSGWRPPAGCCNPLPGPEPRETSPPAPRTASRSFQSAPGTGAPGDPESAKAAPTADAFQSAPGTGAPGDHRPQERGRFILGGFNPLPGPEPRETGRTVVRLPSLHRFQSAPGTGAPGDGMVVWRQPRRAWVSIRSRDRSPGRPIRSRRVRSGPRSFNPLPGPEPRETLLFCESSNAALPFQSAPGTGAPGDPTRRAACRTGSRFNPLPGPEPRETRP